MRPWLEKSTKGATGFSNGAGLFPALALGTFQHSGSKGGGPATKKGRKERGRVQIYTKGGGEIKLLLVSQSYPLSTEEAMFHKGQEFYRPEEVPGVLPGTSDKHFRFLSAHIIFIS